MTRTQKILVSGLALVALAFLFVVGIFLVGPFLQRSIFYPKPQTLPPVVAETTPELLARLGSLLETNAPSVARALQPGLSLDQIAALESEGGFRLTEDLRALYRWHNGVATNSSLGLLPGHHFPPLDEQVRERAHVRTEVASSTGAQRAFYAMFTGHRTDWLEVFPDGAGDGYFFDPHRSEAEGSFFYHLTEEGYYVWFPSFGNFLSGVIEGYETGVIKASTDGSSFDQDYDRSEKIWQRLATMSAE
jgi:cell wall assembly regulator SMI1